MKIICGYREVLSSSDAVMNYLCIDKFLTIKETSTMVDGLGGIIWDGTFLLCRLLETLPLRNLSVFELGAGTGLSGIVASKVGSNVILTDRVIDLAQYNIFNVQSLLNEPLSAICCNLDWGDDTPIDFGEIDVIIGAEITCLLKQQENLIRTLDSLCGSKTFVLFTFDGLPPPNNNRYELEFRNKIAQLGFISYTVLTGSVRWSRNIPNDIDGQEMVLEYLANTLSDTKKSQISYATLEVYDRQLHDHSMSDENTSNQELHLHHISAFFRRSAGNTCSRCHDFYIHVLNHPFACRFHTGYFVCRRHPGETNLSINGLGDGLGYYGNGRSDWDAKFWDCCGSENPLELGCSAACHVPYT